MHARNAKLPDAFAIEQLIQVHVGDGTLLAALAGARSVRTSATSSSSRMKARSWAAARLHLYGMHLAEIRSITVTSSSKGKGAGRVLVDALLKEAEKQSVTCVCLFTRIPAVSSRAWDFQEVEKEALPGQGS